MSDKLDFEIDDILNEFMTETGNANNDKLTDDIVSNAYTSGELDNVDAHLSESYETVNEEPRDREYDRKIFYGKDTAEPEETIGKTDKKDDRKHGKKKNSTAENERKSESPAVRVIKGIIGVIFAAISVAMLFWIAVNVHPATVKSVNTVIGDKVDLVSRIDASSTNSKADALSGLSVIKKVYKIEENAVAAPVPDPYGFKEVANTDASKLEVVIQQARDTGLLSDDEEMVFNPNAEFYYDSNIKYYMDDTILVICWKEVIDGNTCSFCEVKVADASQFRRKFVNDTFSPDTQDYASNIAKSVNAVVGMNADFYAFRNFGIVVYQRNLFRFNEDDYMDGLKNYNCVDTAFVDGDGNFKFFHRGEESTPKDMEKYIKDNDIVFSIAFGPVLVENGELQTCDSYPAGEVNTGYSRAGIGQIGPLHYLYMSLNHSVEKEARWTVNEFAQHFYDKGVVDAYCLDGGQTSEIVFNGEPYNYIDFNAERTVTDIIYFATALNSWEG